jgi:hypothetical protein
MHIHVDGPVPGLAIMVRTHGTIDNPHYLLSVVGEARDQHGTHIFEPLNGVTPDVEGVVYLTHVRTDLPTFCRWFPDETDDDGWFYADDD